MPINHEKNPNIKRKRLLHAAIFLVLIFFIAIGSWYVAKKHSEDTSQKHDAPQVTIEAPKPINNAAVNKEESVLEQTQAENIIPASAEIKMQFASQAPYGNWDQPYQDACEEASIIIDRYYLDKMNLTKDIMNDQILKMVDWQIQNWGEHANLTSEKTLELAKQFYGLDGKVIYDYNIDIIKQYVADGVPVLIPADGKKLNNPNFKNGGPEYHMLVIKGYDSKNFITNDPGTRKGEGYVYNYDTIINSIKNPYNGQKSILVLYK